MKKNILLTTAFLILSIFAPAGVAQESSRVLADDHIENEYTADDEASARLIISEASGIRTRDGQVITWITMQRASARDLTIASFVSAHHYRHTRSETRPYMAYMNRNLTCPQFWPGGCPDWDARGRDAWEDVLQLVHRVHTGQISHGCSETPIDWGGREVDCDNLQARLRGNWHEVSCGGNTVNMILARGHQEPVPDLQCALAHEAARARREARRAARAR